MVEHNDSLEEQELRRACRNILWRAQACIEAGGEAFEYKLKLLDSRVVLKIKSFFFLSGQVITLFLLVDNRPVQNLRAFVLH